MVSSLMLLCVSDSLAQTWKNQFEDEVSKIITISSIQEMEKAIGAAADISVAIIEVNSSDGVRWDVLRKVHGTRPNLKIILLGNSFNQELHSEAMRFGVFSILFKPFSNGDAFHVATRALKEADSDLNKKQLLLDLYARVQRSEGVDEDRFWYVSKSHAMEPVNEWLTVLRRESMKGGVEPSVFISGDAGSGEEGIARMVYAASRRGRKTWLSLRCGAVSAEQIEGELFGYEKGAFPEAIVQKRGLIELAHGGTLFLKDVDALPESVQIKLNRFLQSGVFQRIGDATERRSDVRIIASALTDSNGTIKNRKFREDLHRRLSQMSIQIPTLRQRKDDIIPMAIQFARRVFRQHNRVFSGFSSEAETALSSYSWPGNVEELYSVVERVSLTAEGEVGVKDLYLGGVSSSEVAPDSGVTVPNLEEGLNYTALKKKWCDAFEKEFLRVSLRRNSGNVSAAAREAKLDRSNFLRLLRRHGLKAEAFRRVSQLPSTGGLESAA